MLYSAMEAIRLAFVELARLYTYVLEQFGAYSLMVMIFFFGCVVRFVVLPFFGVRLPFSFRSGSSDSVKRKFNNDESR